MTEIFTIPLGGTKVFLLRGTSGVVMVDAGMPKQEDRILQGLAAHGLGGRDVRLILITHGHMDHIGSITALREVIDAPVAIHAGDADMVRTGQGPESKPTARWARWVMGLFGKLGGGGESATLEPDIVFDAPWRLDEYGVAAEVLPTPGHSPGSVSILLDSGEAIIGDMAMAWGRRPTKPFIAWDLDKNWESLRAVLDRKPTQIYLTHGGVYPPETLAALLP
ncbi:MAG: MBL fold metallo-hydrolase [Anaerolineae bacterium]|nr:MBL fold metallo-hydrolase [Anaerolineae bacterium]